MLKGIERAHREGKSLLRRHRRFELPLARNLDPLACVCLRSPVSLDQPPSAIRQACWNTGLVEECNDAFARMLGFSTVHKVLGQSPEDLFPGQAGELKHLRVGGRLEVGLMRPSGRRWYRFRFSGVREGQFLVGVWVAVTDITRVKRLQEEFRILAGERDKTLERERGRISREIHDQLGQQLGALRLALSAQALGNPSLSPSEMMQELDSAIRSVRRIATDLRPPVLDHFGLGAAVEWQVQEFARTAGVQCSVQIVKGLHVDAARSLAMFRILQESLTNIGRHAHAGRVEVALATEGDVVRLGISDDGCGFEETSGAGYRSLGLLGMRERANSVGGVLTISHRQGGGTVVEACFFSPLTAQSPLAVPERSIGNDPRCSH